MTSQPATGGTGTRVKLAAVCSDMREGGPEDAVGGVVPTLVATPATVAEAVGTMRAAAEAGLAVVPRGSGSRLSWGMPPRRCDLIVSTARLNRVTEHEAGDWVASAEAGTPLDQLAGVLARAGQQLTLDAPAAPGHGPGTVGGVVATGAAGPWRLRYGTPRDLLTGVTVIRPDGVLAHSGGKVVKNVAGYDLGKLFAGSYGTLGLIVAATFRLHPVPPARAWVTLSCDGPSDAARAVAAAVDSPLLASAVEADRPAPGAPVTVSVLLEGNPAGVPARVSGLLGLLGPGATAADEPPDWWGHGAASESTLIRVTFWSGALDAVLDAVDETAAGCGLEPATGGSAGAGVLYVTVGSLAAPEAVARFVGSLRTRVAKVVSGGLPPVRGSVVVLHAPAEVREQADLWGPVPGVALMRAVKEQFDPGHRMAPGRFAGGI